MQEKKETRSPGNFPAWINFVFARFTIIYPGRFLQSVDNIADKAKKGAFIQAVKWEWVDDIELRNLDMKTAGYAVDLCKKKLFPPNCPADFAEAVKLAKAELKRAEERMREAPFKALPVPPSETEKAIQAGAEIAKRVKEANPSMSWGELQKLVNQAIRESKYES